MTTHPSDTLRCSCVGNAERAPGFGYRQGCVADGHVIYAEDQVETGWRHDTAFDAHDEAGLIKEQVPTAVVGEVRGPGGYREVVDA